MSHKAHVRPDFARRLDVYRVMLELAARVRPLLPLLRRFDVKIASQMKNCLASMAQNYLEGMRRTGRDRAYHLTVSLGSTAEARAILDYALALGVIDAEVQRAVDQLADRTCAMLYRLWQRAA